MSSNMTPIDEGFIQYPVPGIDNNSQGFRDRYSIIRSNLNTAREEISVLNTNTAKINQNNNFGGNKIINADLTSATFETNTAEANVPVVSDSLSVSWNSGNVHVIRVGNSANPLQLSFVNWPSAENRFAKLTLLMFADPNLQGSRSIVWPNNAKINFDPVASSVLLGDDSTETVKIFEVFTYNSGTSLFVNYLGLYE
jgi:hypothetical protein